MAGCTSRARRTASANVMSTCWAAAGAGRIASTSAARVNQRRILPDAIAVRVDLTPGCADRHARGRMGARVYPVAYAIAIIVPKLLIRAVSRTAHSIVLSHDLVKARLLRGGELAADFGPHGRSERIDARTRRPPQRIHLGAASLQHDANGILLHRRQAQLFRQVGDRFTEVAVVKAGPSRPGPEAPPSGGTDEEHGDEKCHRPRLGSLGHASPPRTTPARLPGPAAAGRSPLPGLTGRRWTQSGRGRLRPGSPLRARTRRGAPPRRRRSRVAPRKRAPPRSSIAGLRPRRSPAPRRPTDGHPSARRAARHRALDPADDRTAWVSPSSLLLPISEQGAQGPPRVEHFRPDGAFGDAEDAPDFAVRVAFYVEQDDGRAASFGELGQGLAQPPAQLPPVGVRVGQGAAG